MSRIQKEPWVKELQYEINVMMLVIYIDGLLQKVIKFYFQLEKK